LKSIIKTSLLLPALLFAEPKVLDLFVGNEQIGTYLFTVD